MRKLITKFFIYLLTKILGRYIGLKNYQSIFEKLHSFSLIGMNIGGGTDIQNSGEKETLIYIKQKLNEKDPVIFDIGANVGLYTLLVSKIFNNASIYSFEPSLITYNKLLANTANFKNVKTYNIGFGEKNSKSTLYSNESESGLSSVYPRKLEHFNISLNIKEEIELKTIDTFCEENNIKRINFMKLDIEGNEFSVLKGSSLMLKKKGIDFIQFEFGGCNIDSKTYFQDFYFLLKEDFNIYRIVRDGVYKINHYTETKEIFTTTNYLAELRN